MVGGKDLSGLSERLSISGPCGVNGSNGSALHLSEVCWLNHHVELVANRRSEKFLGRLLRSAHQCTKETQKQRGKGLATNN